MLALFSLILLKLIPLYVVIGLGFIAGRKLQADRDTVSKIVFYLLVPMVFFSSVARMQITPSILLLPFIVFSMSALICGLFYLIGKRTWREKGDATGNVLAMAAGNGNTGYFGLPVAMMLFDVQGVALYLILVLGMVLYENTLGFYITARGHTTAMQSLRKLLKLPTLHAFLWGAAMSAHQIALPEAFLPFFDHVKGAYSIMGMMIIGLGLAAIRDFSLDIPFIGLTFLAKFLIWPALTAIIIGLDLQFLHWYGDRIHDALKVIAIVPLAANTVVLASVLNAHPEKAATAVFASTLVALVYVPLMVAWWM